MTLKEFVEREDDTELSLDKRRELGFTFSFPVKQMSVSSGVLMKWTKGFAIGDMVRPLIFYCFIGSSLLKAIPYFA